MSRLSPEAVEALDADILQFIARRHEQLGEDASGLYNYYVYRLRSGFGLTEYERALLDLLGDATAVYHVGIGIGTLAAGLARSGVRSVGFEMDEKRYAAAVALRSEIASGTRYDIRLAAFPDGLDEFEDVRDATLLFTNVGAGWDEAQLDDAIEAMRGFAESYLDLRLFGWPRETEEEREALAARIAAAGLVLTPMLPPIPGAYYHRARRAPAMDRAKGF